MRNGLYAAYCPVVFKVLSTQECQTGEVRAGLLVLLLSKHL